MGIGSRVSEVTTNTGMWKGGGSPHGPTPASNIQAWSRSSPGSSAPASGPVT